MNVNKSIIATTLVIMGVGIIHAWTSKPPQGITPIVLGGYVLMLVLSIFDLLNPDLGRISQAIAMLALVTVLLTEGIPILQQVGIITGGTSAKSTSSTTNNTTPGGPGGTKK